MHELIGAMRKQGFFWAIHHMGKHLYLFCGEYLFNAGPLPKNVQLIKSTSISVKFLSISSASRGSLQDTIMNKFRTKISITSLSFYIIPLVQSTKFEDSPERKVAEHSMAIESLLKLLHAPICHQTSSFA